MHYECSDINPFFFLFFLSNYSFIYSFVFILLYLFFCISAFVFLLLYFAFSDFLSYASSLVHPTVTAFYTENPLKLKYLIPDNHRLSSQIRLSFVLFLCKKITLQKLYHSPTKKLQKKQS